MKKTGLITALSFTSIFLILLLTRDSFTTKNLTPPQALNHPPKTKPRPTTLKKQISSKTIQPNLPPSEFEQMEALFSERSKGCEDYLKDVTSEKASRTFLDGSPRQVFEDLDVLKMNIFGDPFSSEISDARDLYFEKINRALEAKIYKNDPQLTNFYENSDTTPMTTSQAASKLKNLDYCINPQMITFLAGIITNAQSANWPLPKRKKLISSIADFSIRNQRLIAGKKELDYSLQLFEMLLKTNELPIDQEQKIIFQNINEDIAKLPKENQIAALTEEEYLVYLEKLNFLKHDIIQLTSESIENLIK